MILKDYFTVNDELINKRAINEIKDRNKDVDISGLTLSKTSSGEDCIIIKNPVDGISVVSKGDKVCFVKIGKESYGFIGLREKYFTPLLRRSVFEPNEEIKWRKNEIAVALLCSEDEVDTDDVGLVIKKLCNRIKELESDYRNVVGGE